MLTQWLSSLDEDHWWLTIYSLLFWAPIMNHELLQILEPSDWTLQRHPSSYSSGEEFDESPGLRQVEETSIWLTIAHVGLWCWRFQCDVPYRKHRGHQLLIPTSRMQKATQLGILENYQVIIGLASYRQVQAQGFSWKSMTILLFNYYNKIDKLSGGTGLKMKMSRAHVPC